MPAEDDNRVIFESEATGTMLCSEGDSSGQCAGLQAALMCVGGVCTQSPLSCILGHLGITRLRVQVALQVSVSSWGRAVLQLSTGCPTEPSYAVMTQHWVRRQQPAQTHLLATVLYTPIPKQTPTPKGSQAFSVHSALIILILFVLSALGQNTQQFHFLCG